MNEKWLLCDFHIHTTFSDGEVELDKVIDLYGEQGFDVIAITDHLVDDQYNSEYKRDHQATCFVEREWFREYLQRVWKEARRAWEQYSLLVLPSAEITNNTAGYHILGLDLKEYVDPGLSVEKIVRQVHAQGGVAVACHPHRKTKPNGRYLRYLWDNHQELSDLFDAWEVANRDDLFNVVGLKKFNYIANSDFHSPRHLYSWKTLLRCEKNPEAVKSAIRNNKAVSIYLFREDRPLAAIASGS
jgi:predicted metal-dependent phosphoesterase TrpH